MSVSVEDIQCLQLIPTFANERYYNILFYFGGFGGNPLGVTQNEKKPQKPYM